MMILSMVVLPAPLGPTSAKRSPGLIWKDAPLKRTRAPKLFSILSTRRIMVPPLTLCAYMKKGPNLRWSLIQCSGGDEGDRTPDLLTASQALSQLSYAPVRRSTIRELGRRCKDNFGKTFRRRGRRWDESAARTRGQGTRDAGSGPRGAPRASRVPPLAGFRFHPTGRHPPNDHPAGAGPIIGANRAPADPAISKPCRFTGPGREPPSMP